jgi:hypothetical protein
MRILSKIASLTIAIGLTTTIGTSPSQSQDLATYKARYQSIVTTINDSRKCQSLKQRKYQGLQYELCTIKGKKLRVTMEGPPGDAGPMVYWENGQPKIVADTAHTVVWFLEGGELVAQINLFGQESLKDTFTAKERKEAIDRCMYLAKLMLKATGRTTK